MYEDQLKSSLRIVVGIGNKKKPRRKIKRNAAVLKKLLSWRRDVKFNQYKATNSCPTMGPQKASLMVVSATSLLSSASTSETAIESLQTSLLLSFSLDDQPYNALVLIV